MPGRAMMCHLTDFLCIHQKCQRLYINSSSSVRMPILLLRRHKNGSSLKLTFWNVNRADGPWQNPFISQEGLIATTFFACPLSEGLPKTYTYPYVP